jgi:hypothetical protein
MPWLQELGIQNVPEICGRTSRLGPTYQKEQNILCEHVSGSSSFRDNLSTTPYQQECKFPQSQPVGRRESFSNCLVMSSTFATALLTTTYCNVTYFHASHGTLLPHPCILGGYPTYDLTSGVPKNFVRGGGGSTNSVEDRGQRERGSGGSAPPP